MDCFSYKVSFSNRSKPKVSATIPIEVAQNVEKRIDTATLDYSLRFKKTGERNKQATFARRPVDYPVFDKRILEDMREIQNKDDPQTFFDIGLKYRRLYEDDAKMIHLQIAYTSFAIAVYGVECPALRNEGILLGQYLYNSYMYGPNFSKFLKRLRNICCIDSFKIDDTGLTLQFNKRMEDILIETKKYFSGFEIKERRHNYDGFLNEGFLIHFNEVANDYLWAFKEVETDEDVQDEFRYNLNALLNKYPADIKQDASKEYSWISDSMNTSSIDPTKREVNRNIVRERKSHGKLTDDFVFSRASIPVSPANVRDSWVPNLDTLYTIKRISNDMRDILEEIPYSAMASSSRSIKRKRRFDVLRSFPTIMIDFKKAGITIPRYIFQIVGDELERNYPEVESFRYIKSFVGAKVFDNGEARVPPRGSGLGNANEIFTLIQCVIAMGICQCDENNDVLIYNDDGIWCINASYERSFNSLVSIFQDLGFIINLKKSFVSKFNIFCEEYFHGGQYWGKKQLYFTPIANLLLQPTISYAKKFYHNYKTSLMGTDFDIKIGPLLTKLYGFERHEFEKFLPTQVGGWNYINDSSLNRVLHWVGEPIDRTYVAPRSFGLTKLAKSFVRYIVYNDRNLDSFVCSKIAYKREVLPFRYMEGRELFYRDAKTLVESLNIDHPNDLYNLSHDLLNNRGKKNAKPNIKFGLARKEERFRFKFFSKFLKVSCHYTPRLFEAEFIYASKILSKYLNNKNFAIPEYFIKGCSAAKVRYTTRIVETKGIITRKNLPSHYYNYDRDYVRNLVESIKSGKVLRGLDVFAGVHYYAANKSTVFRSAREDIVIPVVRSLGLIPSVLNLFGKNRLMIAIDAYTRHQSGVEFMNIDHGYMRREIDMLVSTLESVFPNEKKFIRGAIDGFSKNQNSVIQKYAVENGILNFDELRRIILFIQNNDHPLEEVDQKEYPNTGYLGLRKIEYNHLYGYPSIDALLEEYPEGAEDLSWLDTSSSDDSPSYNDDCYSEDISLEYEEGITSRDMKVYSSI